MAALIGGISARASVSRPVLTAAYGLAASRSLTPLLTDIRYLQNWSLYFGIRIRI